MRIKQKNIGCVPLLFFTGLLFIGIVLVLNNFIFYSKSFFDTFFWLVGVCFVVYLTAIYVAIFPGYINFISVHLMNGFQNSILVKLISNVIGTLIFVGILGAAFLELIQYFTEVNADLKKIFPLLFGTALASTIAIRIVYVVIKILRRFNL